MKFKVFAHKIDVAVIGLTNSGKSTFIGSLFRNRKLAKKLFKGNNGGLTKVTVHYEICNCEVASVVHVEFNRAKLLKDISFDAVQEMNKRLNTTYKEFGIEPVSVDEKGFFQISLEENLSKLKDRIIADVDLAIEFINSSAGDQLFKYIKIKVPGSNMMLQVMERYGFESVTFRDSRGFLDLNMNEVEKKSPTLSETGLDGIQACIIMNGQDSVMSNFGREVYGEFVQAIFKSVPTFIIERNSVLKTYIKLTGQELTQEVYEKYLNNPDVIGFNFNEIHKFLTDLKIIDDQGNATSQLIDANKRELILPEVLALKNDENADDYNIYLAGVEVVINKVLYTLAEFRSILLKIINLFEDTNNITKIKDSFVDTYENNFLSRIVSGYNNYEKYPGSLVRPVIGRYDKERLLNDLVNKSLLGPRGGITTWDSRKKEFVYGTTGVFAATTYNILRLIIDNIQEYPEIIDVVSKILGEDPKLINQGLIEVQQCLRYVLFDSFTDKNAHFSGRFIVDREHAVSAIEVMRSCWKEAYTQKYGNNAIDSVYLTGIKEFLHKTFPDYELTAYDYVRFSQLYVAQLKVIESLFDTVSNNHLYKEDLTLDGVSLFNK